MGRPSIKIDFEKLDSLLEIQCTLRECASVLKCSEDTLERAVQKEFNQTFADYSIEKRGAGKASLRRRQYQKAVDGGDTTMLIWLGKQYLGQSDKLSQTAEITNTHIVITPEVIDQMSEEWAVFQKKEFNVSRN